MDRPVDQPESPFEILRRLENVVRTGTIEEVRPGRPARCRIRCGNIVTNWIPWIAGRAGGTKGRVWWAPTKGEQCVMFAPGGDLLNAVVMPGAYSDKNPQGSEDPDLFRMEWGNQGYMEYESKMGDFKLESFNSLTLRVKETYIRMENGLIIMEAGGGRFVLSENGVEGVPDVVAAGVSLKDHKHTGVKGGGEETGGPV